MSNDNFRARFKENFDPEMLDKWISEKLVADFDIVFSESLGEKCSINIVVDMDERPADRTREENQDHFYDTVSVQELLW